MSRLNKKARKAARKEALKIALRIIGTCPVDHYALPYRLNDPEAYRRCVICGWVQTGHDYYQP